MSEPLENLIKVLWHFALHWKKAVWESNQICENSFKMSSDQGRGKNNLYNCATLYHHVLSNSYNYKLDVLSLSIFPSFLSHIIIPSLTKNMTWLCNIIKNQPLKTTMPTSFLRMRRGAYIVEPFHLAPWHLTGIEPTTTTPTGLTPHRTFEKKGKYMYIYMYIHCLYQDMKSLSRNLIAYYCIWGLP